MQALVLKDGVVKFTRSQPEPVAGENEALVAVEAAGICTTDLEIVNGYMEFSGVMGHEFVGTVAKGSRNLVGKRVVAEINCICGKCDMCQSGLSNHCRKRTVLGIDGRDGVFAEYVAVPERNLHILPDAISNEDAIFIEPLASALQIIKQVPIEARQKVVVLGDGRLGLLAVQVLTQRGEKGKVVLVGKHSEKLTFAEKRQIQGFLLSDFLVKPEWDVVVDCTGSADGFATACRLLRPRGKLVLKSTWKSDATIDLSPLVIDELTLIGSRCGPFPDAVNALVAEQVVVNGLVTGRFAISDGLAALEKARQHDQIKVILQF